MISMQCLACQTELVLEKIGSVVYYLCPKCLLLWFENKDSDFLTLAEARTLKNKINKKNALPKKALLCPNCHLELQENGLQKQCFQCGGTITTASDIYKEKLTKVNRAQTKYSLDKKVLQSVVVFGAFSLFLGLNYFLFNKIQGTNKALSAKTQVLGSEIRVQRINNQIIVFFTTDDPVYSIAYLKHNNGTTEVVPINANTPGFTHLLNLQKLDSKTVILNISLLNQRGKVFQQFPVKLP